MNIVLHEHEWAEEMLDSRSLGKKPFETLSRVARYYLDSGYTKKDVRKALGAFLVRCDPMISLAKWSNTVEFAITRAMKYNAINIDYIPISVPEMEKIRSLKGKQIKRLAFTLLCISKYCDIVTGHGNHWVNCKDSDIMRMANINTSIKRQSAMFHELNELGMIRFSKKVDNTNVQVTFCEDGDTEMKVSDFRNLGYQYLLHTGSREYIQCHNCGIVVRKNTVRSDGSNPAVGRPQLYCPECSVGIRTRRAVNSVMNSGGFANRNSSAG